MGGTGRNDVGHASKRRSAAHCTAADVECWPSTMPSAGEVATAARTELGRFSARDEARIQVEIVSSVYGRLMFVVSGL
jgi:hypothetical protein